MVRYIFIGLCFLAAHYSWAQDSTQRKTKIEIVRADELIYNQQVGRYQICRGNVRFKQGSVLMDCDSARFYETVNRIEAFGNIHIRQRDTMDLRGDYLEYDGDTRLAQVSNHVRLTDGEMNLETDRILYDMSNKTGYYTTGGHITNARDSLYSNRGTYSSRSKEFFFKDSVRLTNEDYTMSSDTLNYHTVTKVARFFGPTYIESEENTIFCRYGWYNTEQEISQFSKGVYIEGKENKLNADSMVYYRRTGYGEAHGNLVLTDTVEEVSIRGEFGKYNRFDKFTLVTGDPIAQKLMDDDTLWIRSDTMIDHYDSMDNRSLQVFHHVLLYKSDLQGRSDSLVYHLTDSTISLYSDPIIWADSNQITGDTISILRGVEGIQRLHAYNRGFVAEKDENGFFNQISGKEIMAYFDSGKLHRIDVKGNGQSLYFAQEDSAKYSGVNDAICGNMTIYIDSTTRVRSIAFYQQPKAVFYPLEKLPASKRRLSGLNWQIAQRPKRGQF